MQEGLRSNWGFGWEFALQVVVIFFRWDLKTPCIKNSECESQAKKMILIVISTISHFWSPKLRNFCILIFHGIYSSHTQIFFGRGQSMFWCLVVRGWENFKFVGGPSLLVDLISFWERGEYIFFQKAINDQSCKLRNI